MTAEADFPGFSAGALRFLQSLAANNEREWFRAHKDEYDSQILQPMRRLLTALAPAMLEIDPTFDTDPRGGAISRVHRDMRFSRDKAPYRVNQWLCFKRPGQGWQNRPAYFLEFGPDGYRYGMGHYSATPATMAAARTAIDARRPAFLDAVQRATDAGFAVEGEAYRRPRLPPHQPDAVLEWHRRKSAYLVRNRPPESLFHGPGLADDLRERFTALAPLYRFLAALTPVLST